MKTIPCTCILLLIQVHLLSYCYRQYWKRREKIKNKRVKFLEQSEFNQIVLSDQIWECLQQQQRAEFHSPGCSGSRIGKPFPTTALYSSAPGGEGVAEVHMTAEAAQSSLSKQSSVDSHTEHLWLWLVSIFSLLPKHI